MRPIRLIASFFAALALALSGAPADSVAQGSGKISLIRDAEIENTIRNYAQPVLEAAGVKAEYLSVHLVLDDRLNAFVAGGQRIFINTGLLRNAKDANAIIGVLAHETGHIAHADLAQMQENMRSASAQAIIAAVLGAVAAGVSGRPEALIAGTTMGQSAATGSFLHYTRSMESQADQAALRYLEETGQSARGLMEVLTRLQNQELLAPGRQDPYLRTHPVNQERLTAVREHVGKSRFSDAAPTPLLDYLHQRMRGKLNGYIDPPERTLARYKGNGIEDRYARLFALEKMHRTDEALAIADALIAEKPNDTFFRDTKGYVLWKAGRIAEAVVAYREAVELSGGKLPLLRLSLAQALLEIEGAGPAAEAIDELNMILDNERYNTEVWRLLATGYGRTGDFGAAAYALAEEAMLVGDIDGAKRHIGKALEQLHQGSPMRRKAEDLDFMLKGMKAPG